MTDLNKANGLTGAALEAAGDSTFALKLSGIETSLRHRIRQATRYPQRPRRGPHSGEGCAAPIRQRAPESAGPDRGGDAIPFGGAEPVVICAETGFGFLGRQGDLSYDGLGIELPSDGPAYKTISARAPAELEIVTREPIALAGFLNATSRGRGECRFWVDDNWLEDLFVAGDRTPEIVLLPGRHRLDITTDAPEFRYSVWGFRPIILQSPTIERATPENTAVMAISGYERKRGREVCKLFTTSARRQRIYLHLRGIGERFDMFSSKIVRLRQWIEELPDRYSHVLYVDARDSLFLRGLDVCCEAFNGCGRPILVGAERACWPVMDEVWTESFPHHPSRRRWPNTGIFLGRREKLEQALGLLKSLPQRDDFPAYGKHWDDQFLWQWAWLRGWVSYGLDYQSALVANVTTHDWRIGNENADFLFAPHLIVCDSGASPSIAHFSGASADQIMEQWASFLQAV